MSDTQTMIKALRILAQDIQSGDGVANACIADAADMIERLDKRITELETYNVALANESHEYQQRVKELDEIADTAFKFKSTSNQCLQAWDRLQQLRKEQE